MKKLIVALVMMVVVACVGCKKAPPAQSVSGVKMAGVGEVSTNADGLTVEQLNIMERIKRDNEIGALKHLYVISAYSGQTILYSPVRGKVTSGGKRLTPKTIDGVFAGEDSSASKPVIKVGGVNYTVSELANEDGTYGSTSTDYLFWFDPSGKYHQHLLSGGQIVHISDEPLAVKGVIITVDGGKK